MMKASAGLSMPQIFDDEWLIHDFVPTLGLSGTMSDSAAGGIERSNSPDSGRFTLSPAESGTLTSSPEGSVADGNSSERSSSPDSGAPFSLSGGGGGPAFASDLYIGGNSDTAPFPDHVAAASENLKSAVIMDKPGT